MNAKGTTMRRVLLLLAVLTVCWAKPQVSEDATRRTPPDAESDGFQTPQNPEKFTPSPASIPAVENGENGRAVKDLAPRFFFPMGGKGSGSVKASFGLEGSIGGSS